MEYISFASSMVRSRTCLLKGVVACIALPTLACSQSLLPPPPLRLWCPLPPLHVRLPLFLPLRHYQAGQKYTQINFNQRLDAQGCHHEHLSQANVLCHIQEVFASTHDLFAIVSRDQIEDVHLLCKGFLCFVEWKIHTLGI